MNMKCNVTFSRYRILDGMKVILFAVHHSASLKIYLVTAKVTALM